MRFLAEFSLPTLAAAVRYVFPAALLALGNVVRGEDSDPGREAEKTAHVYLFSGQSNMVGSGRLADLDAELLRPPADVFFWNGADFEPLIPGKTKTSQTRDRFGPELGFARKLRSLVPSGQPIYLVKFALSGQPLHHGWNGGTWEGGEPKPGRKNFYPGKSADDPAAGRHYQVMKAYFQAALGKLREEGKVVRVDGFLWMQGEADAKNPESAGSYAASLKLLKSRIWEDFGIDSAAAPFVYGQVLPYEPALPRFTHRNELRAQMAAADERSGAAESVPGAVMTSTDFLSGDLMKDTVHFNAAGCWKLGEAFAEAVSGFQRQARSAEVPSARR